MARLEWLEFLDQLRLSPHLSTSCCGPGSLGMGGDIGTDSFGVAGWFLSPLPCPASPPPSSVSVPRKEGRKPLEALPCSRTQGSGDRESREGTLAGEQKTVDGGREKRKSGDRGSPKSGHAITLLYTFRAHEPTTYRAMSGITQSPKSPRRGRHGRTQRVERQGLPPPPCPWHC